MEDVPPNISVVIQANLALLEKHYSVLSIIKKIKIKTHPLSKSMHNELKKKIADTAELEEDKNY